MQASTVTEVCAPQAELIARWAEVRKLWKSTAFGAFATAGPEGPQVTPIGSIYLHEAEPRGYFHPVFANRLRKALSAEQRFELLLVSNSPSQWLAGLLRGRFERMVAVRLKGRAHGPRRAATPEEIARWHKRVSAVRWTRGHDLLWKDVRFVQELSFDALVPVRFGALRNGA